MKRFRAVGKIALIAAAVMIAGAVASEPTWAAAKSAKQINSEVNACLDRFYRQVPGSKELAAQAKGMLVMPKVIKAGLIVGGEYGEGALRIDKKSAGYYNLASGSVGFQIGAEEKDIVILFMTDEAIEKFKNHPRLGSRGRCQRGDGHRGRRQPHRLHQDVRPDRRLRLRRQGRDGGHLPQGRQVHEDQSQITPVGLWKSRRHVK